MRVIVVGSKTNSVFFSRTDPSTNLSSVYKANLDSGEVTKLVTLPPRASVASINADETIGVGTYEENATPASQEYGSNRTPPTRRTQRPQQGRRRRRETWFSRKARER